MPDTSKKIRLDKFLTQAAELTRSEARQIIKKGKVDVGGEIVKKPEYKVSTQERVCIDGEEVVYEQFRYIMLHKPAGVISATESAEDRTVLDLITNGKKGLFPVGRLDKDTEGLLLLTLPAKLELTEKDNEVFITVCEGRFHQVKRMAQAVGRKVTYLKRISMGSLVLDAALEKGEYRPLFEQELSKLLQEDSYK